MWSSSLLIIYLYFFHWIPSFRTVLLCFSVSFLFYFLTPLADYACRTKRIYPHVFPTEHSQHSQLQIHFWAVWGGKRNSTPAERPFHWSYKWENKYGNKLANNKCPYFFHCPRCDPSAVDLCIIDRPSLPTATADWQGINLCCLTERCGTEHPQRSQTIDIQNKFYLPPPTGSMRGWG